MSPTRAVEIIGFLCDDLGDFVYPPEPGEVETAALVLARSGLCSTLPGRYGRTVAAILQEGN